ncbi:MAG: endonuclease MutS2 [Bacteroidota bacterium]
MNVYPKDITSSLGFDQVKTLLSSLCQSDKGALMVSKMKPTDALSSLEKWHGQTREMMLLKSSERDKVAFRFPAIDAYLVKVKVPGSFLQTVDFHELKIGVNTLTSWTSFFKNKAAEYPELYTLSASVEVAPGLSDAIDRVVDEKGEIRDTASRELADIRSQISKTERSVRSAIQKVLQKAKTDQFTDEDSSLTIRDGRLVIPVKAEFKKRISGFVHDESATGQTVYMEPSDVLDLNNKVQELKHAERREIIRILIALSDQVRMNLKGLEKGSGLLEKLDFIYAKAQLGEQLEGVVPTFKPQRSFRLINAVHPLLYLSHKESNKPVVPLNLQLDYENRILIISGPNAGGKSVALKTLGLLQYMFQCGLPIPVGEESELGVFSHIFLDIGDTQSIEDDLSTYSSHLTAMKYFLAYSNKQTLFLIDEFGKGTEPQFGGAIAESVLLELNKNKAFGLVTTHYQNLKKIGDDVNGLVNGAMKYDLDKLEPLFQLEVGKPGSSFAFEIAGKIGLPPAIINASKKKVGSSHVAYDQQLAQLEKEKGKFEKLTRKLETDRKDLEKTRKEYEELRSMLDAEQKRLIKEAKQEAKYILTGANKEVERVIREIQESKASKERTKQLREELSKKATAFEPKEQPKKSRLKVGDAVKMAGQDMVGTIQKINGKQVEVLFGALKSIVSADKLESTKATPQQRHQRKVKKLGIDLNSKMASFSHELSIRGLRAEEAMTKVESFIDEALLLGMDEVRIVHGKGHGVLREIVRNYTKNHPRIAGVENEHADRGGDGISIVRLQ